MTPLSGNFYLKWTCKGRVPSYQGGEPIPLDEWTPRVADHALCERGWHACRWEDVLSHISTELWVCELRGTIVEGTNKVAAESLRIVRKVPISERELRLFAADCAERVLPIFEREHPDDSRPREAIRVARLYAEGGATRSELDAAEAAAWDVAWASSIAAWDAARAASATAWDAAWDAAWAAERTWQTDRLLVHYGGLNPADFAHREVS